MADMRTESVGSWRPAAPCGDDLVNPNLVSHNPQVLLSLTALSASLSAFTVLANCAIIAAIARAYMYGIVSYSAPAAAPSTPGGTGSRMVRHRLGTDSSNIPIVLMLSMAVTDALLGAVIMPLYTTEILYNGQWPLGAFSCRLRMYLDIILSVSSINHVTCLAIDRYLAVCRPFLHQTLSVRTGVAAVLVSWSIPVVIVMYYQIPGVSTIDVFKITAEECFRVNNSFVNKTIREEEAGGPPVPFILVCGQSFNTIAHSFTVITSFYIPFIALIVLYTLIMLEIRTISKRRSLLKGKTKKRVTNTKPCPEIKLNLESQATEEQTAVSAGSSDGEICVCFASSSERSHAQDPCTSGVTVVTSAATSSHSQLDQDSERSRDVKGVKTNLKRSQIVGFENTDRLSKSTETIEAKGHLRSSPTPADRDHSSSNNSSSGDLARAKSRKSVSKTVKAAHAISLVVACFLVCWLPFSIHILYYAVTESAGAGWAMTLNLWLGYINSSLNPVLYCGHVTIRAALRQLVSMPGRQSQS